MMSKIAIPLLRHPFAKFIHTNLTLPVEDSCLRSLRPRKHDFSALEMDILLNSVSLQASQFDSSIVVKLCDWLYAWVLSVPSCAGVAAIITMTSLISNAQDWRKFGVREVNEHLVHRVMKR